MVGAVLVIVVMLALIPVMFVVGGVLMAIAGKLFKDDAERRYEGSELLDTNV